MTLARRPIVVSVVAGLVLLVLALTAWPRVGPVLIESAYHGESIGPLNTLVAHHVRNHPRELTLENLRRHASYGGAVALALLAIALPLLTMAWIARQRVAGFLRGFFLGPDHAINLAAFRILIFAISLQVTFRSAGQVKFFAEQGADLLVPPAGLGSILERVPIDPARAGGTLLVMQVACITGLIGYLSRASALVACVAGVYALGVPNFFGKVDHIHHHLLWFLAILSVCRCGDALSVDAVIKAMWQRTPVDPRQVAAPSAAYALPLRFAWLLLGVLYLFPGLWKLALAAPDWVAGDALKYHLHRKWLEHGDWLPAVRIDRWPLVYRAAGLGTIAFEIGFIVLVFFRRGRMVAFVAAQSFHLGVRTFMRISFWTLQWCLLALIDWKGLFGWIGRLLFPRPLAVTYDGGCGLCRRTIATIRSIDLLGRIDFAPGDGPMRDMHVQVGDRLAKGYDGYRVMIRRLPVLWPLLPFMYLWPATTIGPKIYRRVADSRTCRLAPPEPLPGPKPARRWPVAVVGSFLVAGNVLFGLGGIVDAWPLSCYPTFAGKVSPERVVDRVTVVDDKGERTLTPRGYSAARWIRAVRHFVTIKDVSERNRRFGALWASLVEQQPKLSSVTAVRFHRDRVSIAPEARDEPPLTTRLVAEFKVTP